MNIDFGPVFSKRSVIVLNLPEATFQPHPTHPVFILFSSCDFFFDLWVREQRVV